MAKSSAPLLILPVLVWADAGHGQIADPQAMAAAQSAQVRAVVNPRCAPGEDEITVCGRRDDRGPQGPLPAIPYAPAPGRRIRGEAPGGFGCIQRCPQPLRIDIIRAITNIRRAIEERN